MPCSGSPFACRHLDMLTRYRDPLATHENMKHRLEHLEAAWSAIDAAMAALDEIRFEGQRWRNPI